jgi:hypothetical protein
VWTPARVSLAKIKLYPTSNKTIRFYGYDDEISEWRDLTGAVVCAGSTWNQIILSNQYCLNTFSHFKFGGVGTSWALAEFCLFERPTAKFFRGLNKVKDRTDTECYWINLGYATIDANGAITALTHYTDLRNNYPGGMRVEA